MTVLHNAVVVDGDLAGQLLDVLLDAYRRRSERGAPLPSAVRVLIGELAEVGRNSGVPSTVPTPFRNGTVVYVNTKTAARALGTTTRNVVARLHRRTLVGHKDAAGRWLVAMPREVAA